MKKKLLLSTLMIVFIYVIFAATSCKKNNSLTATTNTPDVPVIDSVKTALLTKSVWQKTLEGTDLNRDGIIDQTSPHFIPCNADDMALFQADGTLQWLEGPTKCDPTSPNVYYLTWRLTTNGLFMLGRDLKLYRLTDHELSIYYEDKVGNDSAWQMMKFAH
jgi:hypothetical protein